MEIGGGAWGTEEAREAPWCPLPRVPQVGISSETKKQEEAHASKVAAAEALEAELLSAPKPAWPEVACPPR